MNGKNLSLKDRVKMLLALEQKVSDDNVRIRPFCTEHGINYKSLFNAMKADVIGINLVHSFKKAIPELNLNWFIYGEGPVLTSHYLTSKIVKY
jgi:hypothetical protein